MKYADINKKYTAVVTGYLAQGYTINTRTMDGSQGEYAHIDLTDGTEVIRIMVDIFHVWDSIPLDGVEIIVGRADSEVEPNSENDYRTIWNDKLTIISQERFYEVGASRRHGKFYGTREDAVAAQEKRYQRYNTKHEGGKAEDITSKAMEIAKKIIRREFDVKRVCEADVTVSKSNNCYTVKYKGKTHYIKFAKH